MGQLDNLVTAISTRDIWSLTSSNSLSTSIVPAVHSFIRRRSSFILASSNESWEFVFFERADPIQTMSTTNHLLSKIFYAIESHFPWHLWCKTASSSLFFFFLKTNYSHSYMTPGIKGNNESMWFSWRHFQILLPPHPKKFLCRSLKFRPLAVW